MQTFSTISVVLVIAMSHAARSASAQEQEPKPADDPSPVGEFEAREFTAADGTVLHYRLLKPVDYDAHQKYPLVLFLHGAGERGDDNKAQLVHGGRNFADATFRKRNPAIIVAPQCPAESTWASFRPRAGSEGSPEAPLQRVFELLDSLQKEFSVDATRIYGMGLSMGGFGTWDILRRKPDLLAAAVPICGGGVPESATAYATTPIWVVHGSADDAVPVDLSRKMVDALRAAGSGVIYTEYDGVGHDSWTQTFDNQLIWDWLFAQRKNAGG
jgi:predicted peptidase